MQQNNGPDDDPAVEPAGFDPFTAHPSTPNLRQVRLRRRRRYIRMVLCFSLPVAFVLVSCWHFDVELNQAFVTAVLAFHGVFGLIELFFGERREPNSVVGRDWLGVYARWFGFRDW